MSDQTPGLATRTLQYLGLAEPAANIYYRYFHGFNSATPQLPAALEWIFKVAAQYRCLHDGDYCEFGVFKGYSFWKAQQEAAKNRLPCRFFGFDSFVGLPDPGDLDRTEHGELRAGQYRCSLQQVTDNLNAAGGIDWKRTFLIPGYFRDSLTPQLIAKLGIRKVGVALIDCDLYASTLEALNFLRGLIGEKTLLIMDAWNSFGADDNRGQRRAIREFMQTQPHLHLEPLMTYGVGSQVFVVRDTPGDTISQMSVTVRTRVRNGKVCDETYASEARGLRAIHESLDALRRKRHTIERRGDAFIVTDKNGELVQEFLIMRSDGRR